MFNNFFSLLPNVEDFDRELTNAIFRLSALVCDILVHVALVSNIWPRIHSFLAFLESVDYDLQRPDLCQVQRISLMGLVYTFVTVSQRHQIYFRFICNFLFKFQLVLNWYFGIYWELFHPTRKFNWLDTIQNTIRITANQWFTVLPVWLYAILGELLIVYFTSIARNLQLLHTLMPKFQSQTVAKQISIVLRPLKPLYLAINLLTCYLNSVLMINCFLSFILMLICSYSAIIHFEDGEVRAACWDALDVVDSFVRYWLVCHTADRMGKAVSVVAQPTPKVDRHFKIAILNILLCFISIGNLLYSDSTPNTRRKSCSNIH